MNLESVVCRCGVVVYLPLLLLVCLNEVSLSRMITSVNCSSINLSLICGS